MKLHASRPTALNTVTAYGAGYVEINAQRYDHALLVQPEAPVAAWAPSRFEDLSPEHFEAIVVHAPEVVLLGTGPTQRFPHTLSTATQSRARWSLA